MKSKYFADQTVQQNGAHADVRESHGIRNLIKVIL